MTSYPRLTMPLALTVAALTCLTSVSVRAQEAPEVVLSDGPAFCAHLQQSLSSLEQRRHAPLPADVERLSDEGTRLCDEGSVRAGIMRLREAMVMMAHGYDAPQTSAGMLPTAK